MKFPTFRANNAVQLGLLVVLALGTISISAARYSVDAMSITTSQLPGTAVLGNSKSIFLPAVMRKPVSYCSDDFNQPDSSTVGIGPRKILQPGA